MSAPFGFSYGGKRIYDKGGLTGKKALVGAALGGRPHMFAPDGIHGPVHDMLRHLLRGTLGYCGMGVPQPFFAWHVPYITPEARDEMMADYIAHLESVEDLPLMEFPHMADFSETMEPIRKQ